MAGVYHWIPEPPDAAWLTRIRDGWSDGLIYMAAVSGGAPGP